MRSFWLLPLLSVVVFSCSPPPPPGVPDPDPLEPTPVIPEDAGVIDAGVVVVHDSGVPEVDAGVPVVDAGVPVVDAGVPEVDAGVPVVDAGVPEVDAGVPVVDAGVPVVDAGVPVVDAGVPVVDAGVPVVDAGMPVVDAGVPVVDAGVPVCMCSSAQYCVANQCVADTRPPRVMVTASAGQTATTLRVSGTAADDETAIATLEVRINGGSPVLVPVQGGLFDAQLAVSGPRAEFTVVATARDLAGNTASAQTTFDAQPPSIDLGSALNGSCSVMGCTGAVIDANTTSFSIAATITEGLGLASSHPVQIRVLNGSTALVPWTDLVLQSNGTWAWTWSSLPLLDFTQLTLEVGATDAAGNRGTKTLTVIFDRVRPTASFTSHQNAVCSATACTGAIANAASTSLVLAGSTSSDATLSLRVLDGASVALPAVNVPQIGGQWTFSWSTLPDADGRFYAVDLTATDVVRNTSSATLTVLVDRVSPALLITSPRLGALVATAQLGVTATSTDGLGVKLVEAAPSATGPFTASTRNGAGDFVASLPVPLVDAVDQVITVRSTDLAGNARSATVQYTADRVAPRVTLSASDYDCSGEACTGSVVNSFFQTYSYMGTVTDGSAIRLMKSLLGASGPIYIGTGPSTGTNWSWEWSNLPVGEPGAEYTFHLLATDAAGNATEVVRKTWVDTVAPTVSMPVAGQRGVDGFSPVMVFSEPMNVTATLGATTITPAVPMSGFNSADGVSFRFSSPVFQPYAPYTVSVTGPAKDKAGNWVATTSASFLSAAVPRTFPVTVIPPLGSAIRSPRLSVDADGRPMVAYALLTGNAWTAQLWGDTGTGTAMELPRLAGSLPTDLRLTGSFRDADQRLKTTFDVVNVKSNGAVEVESYATTWAGATNSVAFTQSSTAGVTATPTMAQWLWVRPSLDFVPTRSVVVPGGAFRAIVAPNSGPNAMQFLDAASGSWSSAAPFPILFPGLLFDGRASVESLSGTGPYRIRFWDLNQKSEVFSTGMPVQSVTAQAPAKALDRFNVATEAMPAFVAWTQGSRVNVACSASPFAATPGWLVGGATVPESAGFANAMSSAMNATTFAVATPFGSTVRVHTAVASSCAAPPVLTEIGAIPDLREPSVAIDSAGKIWVAGVNAQGRLVITRF